jgi:hypothetical protein
VRIGAEITAKDHTYQDGFFPNPAHDLDPALDRFTRVETKEIRIKIRSKRAGTLVVPEKRF